MKYPMREKYIDEQFGVWFIFGVYKTGNVDISDGNSDVVVDVPRDVAERLVVAHNTFKSVLYKELGGGV